MDGLEQLFPLPTGREKYTDSDIRKISALLRGVNLKWSRVPRIHIVLRTIGALHVLDAFISLGYNDYWLPFNPRTLPDITGASMRDSFIEKQPIVLTKSIDLEKGENGKHQYYAKGEPIPFKTVRYLGSGGYGKVDKVVSSLSHKEYARKRIPRWGFFQRSKANVDSFEIELQLLKRLSHRHIIELLLDTEAVIQEIFHVLFALLPPPPYAVSQIKERLRDTIREAVDLSNDMRTQRAEYMMLPPPRTEYDNKGDIVPKVHFSSTTMNELSGDLEASNGDLETQQATVRIVLFPLVVKKGCNTGAGEEEVVVCPAQVLVAKPNGEKQVTRVVTPIPPNLHMKA